MTTRKKGWYFVRVKAGDDLSMWTPAFYNPDGYSRPTWFIENRKVDEDEFLEVREIEAAQACGVTWEYVKDPKRS